MLQPRNLYHGGSNINKLLEQKYEAMFEDYTRKRTI